MGSHLGRIFRIATWGESHGGAIGVVVEGCPPRLALSEKDIQRDLDRRRPGQSRLTTQRKEADRAEILSGIFEGLTLGTPISILVRNTDAKPDDYLALKDVFRPSHADYTYEAKYGIRNWQGGGRASARETIGRVAAAAIAKKVLRERCGAEILAYVSKVHSIEANVDSARVRASQIERHPVRCPDPKAAEKMSRAIERARKAGDSLGGIVTGVARGVPAGLGDPVFDKLEADLARALMSLPATKGFEIGSGFSSASMMGSEHNDPFAVRGGRVRTLTNRSGGVQGGISNGEDIIVRVAFKPPATIAAPQDTVDQRGRKRKIAAGGRHDPCVLPRAVPLVEAMLALVLVDHYLLQLATSAPAEG